MALLVCIDTFAIESNNSGKTNKFCRQSFGVIPEIHFLSIPTKYQVPKEYINERGKVILFRGIRKSESKRDEESYALKSGYEEFFTHVKEKVEQGDLRAINKIIEATTDGAIIATIPNQTGFGLSYSKTKGSPLISTSFSPVYAQRYAIGTSGSGRKNLAREDYTIQMLEIDPYRLIFDANNVGGTGKSGEIFVLGKIMKEEIVAVKVNNSFEYAEILSTQENPASHGSSRYFEAQLSDLREIPSYKIRDHKNWIFLRDRSEYTDFFMK